MERQRPADPQGVTKFPRIAIVQWFFRNEIFGKIPAVGVAGKDELQRQGLLRTSALLVILYTNDLQPRS